MKRLRAEVAALEEYRAKSFRSNTPGQRAPYSRPTAGRSTAQSAGCAPHSMGPLCLEPATVESSLSTEPFVAQ
ncbi:MAG: hypothetical protein M3071_24925 [Actinomycetota bacterium]|nr:hypothetical protein [Actinomycetota bacterium]